MCPMTSRRAFVTAAVRGVAFALVTALFTAVPLFHGFLWCVYIGFFLTMAFGVKLPEYPQLPVQPAGGLRLGVGLRFRPPVVGSVVRHALPAGAVPV